MLESFIKINLLIILMFIIEALEIIFVFDVHFG